MIHRINKFPGFQWRAARNKGGQGKLVWSPGDVPVVPIQFLFAGSIGAQGLILGHLEVIHNPTQHVIPDYYTVVLHIKDSRNIPIRSAKNLGESGRRRGDQSEEVRPERLHCRRRRYGLNGPERPLVVHSIAIDIALRNKPGSSQGTEEIRTDN